MATRRNPTALPGRAPEGSLTANQVVAANLKLIRERVGYTQNDVAIALSHATGKTYRKTTISSMERSALGGKKRLFDAQELMEFAHFFNVPIMWFFIPSPEHLEMRLDLMGKEHGRNLLDLLYGDHTAAAQLQERLVEIIDNSEQPFLARDQADQALWKFAAARDQVAQEILASQSTVEKSLDSLIENLVEFKDQISSERSEAIAHSGKAHPFALYDFKDRKKPIEGT